MTQLAAVSNSQLSDASQLNQYLNLHKGNYVFDLVNGYGCDPTGVTECSAKVLQAISDASTALSGGGGPGPNGKSALIVGNGTLLVNQTIAVGSDNIKIMGLGGGDSDHFGNGLRFKKASTFTGSYVLDFFGNTTTPEALGGCELQSVVVDGNSNSGTNVTGIRWSVFNGSMQDVKASYCSGNGVEVTGAVGTSSTWNAYNTVLTRVHAEQNSGMGFYIHNSTDGHMTDCFAYYNGLNSLRNAALSNTADGIQINSSGWQINGYHAYSNGGNGLHVVGGCLACQCSGGYLENNFLHGCLLDNAGGAGPSGFRLINNFIWDNGRQTTNQYDNVCVAPTTVAAGGGAATAIITGNHIRQSSNAQLPRYGINLPQGTAQNCTVKDNIVSASVGWGSGPINAFGSGNATTACFVSDNQGFNPVGKEASPPGVPASGTATIPNNYPKTVPYRVFITAGTGAITAVSVAGSTTGMNIAAGTTAMIRVLPGESVTLTYTGTPTWTWFGE